MDGKWYQKFSNNWIASESIFYKPPCLSLLFFWRFYIYEVFRGKNSMVKIKFSWQAPNSISWRQLIRFVILIIYCHLRAYFPKFLCNKDVFEKFMSKISGILNIFFFGVSSHKGSHMCIKPLHSNISMHILHTVLYTFPNVLTRRICLAVKSYLCWWSFPLFSGL